MPTLAVGLRLFLASCINDLHRTIGEDYLHLFAYDTALFCWHWELNTFTMEMKSEFINLYNWCIVNKLTIDEDKTRSTPRVQTSTAPNLRSMKQSSWAWNTLADCFCFVSCPTNTWKHFMKIHEKQTWIQKKKNPVSKGLNTTSSKHSSLFFQPIPKISW